MEKELRGKKPSKLLIIIPSIILVASMVFLGCVVGSNVKKMMGISDESTTIETPETKEITFDEAGKYTVFLQTSGVKNGEYYSMPANIKGLSLKVYSKSENIGVFSPTMNSTMNSGNNEFIGVFEFVIDTPGTYTVEANIDDNQEKNVLLSIQNSNMIFKFVGELFISIIIFIISIGIFIGFLIYWIIKKQKYKQLKSQQESTKWNY